MASSHSSAVSRYVYQQLSRRSLIVCASLVQNPANLGGLCRTAEVFRLASLAIAQETLLQDPRFRDLAVSAQFWQPLCYWPVATLSQQIQDCRRQNYRIIALQQAEQAVSLQDYAFPVQSVLILGRELTGIPPAIVDQADDCILIPQAGIVDSLNVQVAAAIAIYEYARQHPLP